MNRPRAVVLTLVAFALGYVVGFERGAPSRRYAEAMAQRVRALETNLWMIAQSAREDASNGNRFPQLRTV